MVARTAKEGGSLSWSATMCAQSVRRLSCGYRRNYSRLGEPVSVCMGALHSRLRFQQRIAASMNVSTPDGQLP
jgi:hypothetical protein